ncbi:MAG: molybdopterin-dependent oxidoreductase, partial [Actinomycetota bacterium]
GFTLESLAELPATKVDLYEPFILTRSSFVGVSLADLFDSVGIKAEDKIDTVALNEYRYANTAEKFTASDGLLAYEQNGEPIPMDRGGPVRIVFPDGTPLASVLDAWNWALSSIVVK